MGKKQKKAADDRDEDLDALAAQIEGAGSNKEPGKGKKKKKAQKKDDFDEEEILKELEDLTLETLGDQKRESTEEEMLEPPKAEKKKTRKGKKGGVGEEEEEEEDDEARKTRPQEEKTQKAAGLSDEEERQAGGGGGGGGGGGKANRKPSASEEEEEEAGGQDEQSEEEESNRKDKKKKGKVLKEEEEEQEEQEGVKMKTAAQKKAEKKERDRKKKEEDRLKHKKVKEKEEAEPKKTEATPTPAQPIVEEEPEAAEPMGEEETEGVKKKDKKKMKGVKAEKEEKKKGLSKATVKAMQEALAQMKEEEESVKREEEERIRKMEQMETQRLEQERVDQEKREKRKQKEKERKERLKKEGKLLTKSQKEARARAETTLRMLQAQGVEVPCKDSMPKKKPVYGDKRKKKPTAQTAQTAQTEGAPEAPPPVSPEAPEPPAPVEEVAQQPEVKAEPAVDDWEAIVSDEEKDLKKVHIEVKQTPPLPPPAKEASEEEEEEEESEEEEEDEEKEKGGGKDSEEEEEEDSSDSSEEEDGRTKEELLYDRAKKRIEKRRAENMRNVDLERLRSPVVCVLGHVDTGKTKILDKLRHTNVQDGEAGGITQQIGATNVPLETIVEQTRMVKNFDKDTIKIPGMLIIDTPGHESFSNLRNRGSSLCDIAILVVDIMHGLEPQTLESINLLKEKKCPFIVALNKVDRLYDWKKSPETDVVATLKKQKKNTKDEFDERTKSIVLEFAEQGLNAALFHENKDPRTFVSMVPTSAHSGDGMGNLIGLLVELTQTMLARRLAHCDELRAQVMEVKALPGMGTTIDVILINGTLREGETIIVPGVDGPIITQIRGLLLPPPLKELRVKNQYEKHKEVNTAQGVKILGKDLEKTLAGLPLLVAHSEDEIPVLRDELVRELKQTLSSFKLEEKGVYVQASTLGSLEALLEFLRTSKVPYSGINIGPVHKKDVMKASAMLEHDPQYAVILAFDVKVERDSQEMADSLGVRVFAAEIIYHLFDSFTKYREDYKKAKQDEFKNIAVFPVKLRILPAFIFNSRDPIVMGVVVEAGVLHQGTPLCVPSKAFVDIGIVTSIEMNHKTVESAKKGQEICVKIEPIPGDSPKMFGRHFEATDFLVSKINRASIDALKSWFRDEMQKSDWQLIMELKNTFEII
ncbi:eukaryotic translation initiation factor 5B [Gadus chalcogrammus]|uniref:eukaryotic translation initiation factor 5B n=1 Tax=Gadus chalcogrammus TaxID=1042646 RepID=UPI0024C299FA|nr:eukaryotic translation initiation factor 5B [Gadus chalcogrammus]